MFMNLFLIIVFVCINTLRIRPMLFELSVTENSNTILQNRNTISKNVYDVSFLYCLNCVTQVLYGIIAILIVGR